MIRYGKFLFKVKFISRLLKPVELTHKWIKTNFNYQEPDFYSRLFDKSVNWTFEVPPGCIKTCDLKKSVPDDSTLCVLQENKSFYVFC